MPHILNNLDVLAQRGDGEVTFVLVSHIQIYLDLAIREIIKFLPRVPVVLLFFKKLRASK